LKAESKSITARIGLIFTVLIILIGAITLFAPGYKSKPTGTIALSCLGYTSSHNPNTVFIVISNSNPTTIVYFVCDPELKSNGSWPRFPSPVGVRMDLLSPSQSLMLAIKAPSAGGEARIPVLWGTLSPTKRQQLRMFFRTHNYFRRPVYSTGVGGVYSMNTNGLYTNYVENIQLE
jgi:hypothetical protein